MRLKRQRINSGCAAGADRAAKANPELLRPQAAAERRSAWTGEGARPTRAHHTRAHYSLARSIAITSSGVITPVSWLCSSITGNVSRLYLSNSSANPELLRPQEAAERPPSHTSTPPSSALQLGAQHRYYVIGRDHAGQLAVFVYHRQCQQVVLVKQFGEFLF